MTEEKRILFNRNFTVKIECMTCGRIHKNKDIIHRTFFDDDSVEDIPEIEQWTCPDHPQGKHDILLTETLREVEDLI
jgi:hypothetical protein